MGKGIALQFKHKWPDNFRAYERACMQKLIEPGRMFVYDAGGLVKPHYIINFPTKKHWREKSKVTYIETGLRDLVRQILLLKIRSVAIPPLGCGNGGLDWSDVRPLITAALADLPGVEAFLFEPKGAPAPQQMVNRTKRPRMTAARAAIVKIISAYGEMQYALGKIEIQKLVYFLEQAGQPLSLEFVKHKYGPYSDKLRHVLKAMDGHYVQGVGDHAGEAEIVIVPNALREADEYLASQSEGPIRDRVERVSRLIAGFETPYGMELLATVHWVASHEPKARSADEAVAAVRAWNDRKRRILRPQHVAIAWDRLKTQGWLGESQRIATS
jgi:O-acetyl-ADP-ribose deacetylase (regulator of RNase III)